MTSKRPRSYGRQAKGKTIKSLSLDADVAAWAEAQAEAREISFSRFMEEVLSMRMQETAAPADEQTATTAKQVKYRTPKAKKSIS